MKNFFLCIVSIFVFSCLFGRVDQKANDNPFCWNQIQLRWSSYAKKPNEKNARFLCQLLPNKKVSKTKELEEYEKTYELIYNELDILERNVLSGCKSSVELAFRLISISDGVLSHEIIIILGDYLKIDATNFLRTISKFPYLQKYYLGKFLWSIDPQFLGKKSELILELKQKQKCLEKVSEESLLQLKQKCLKIISKSLIELREE